VQRQPPRPRGTPAGGLTVTAGAFCWVDLAATDAAAARSFYRGVFGWAAHEHAANGGTFTRWQLDGRDIGSMYPLSAAQREHQVPSHWTAYVRVNDIDTAAQRVVACGGRVLVQPFLVTGVARIALVLDAVGAQLGLWQSLGPQEVSHG